MILIDTSAWVGGDGTRVIDGVTGDDYRRPPHSLACAASVRYPDTTRLIAVTAHSAANAQAISAKCCGNRHISANATIVSVPSASPSR